MCSSTTQLPRLRCSIAKTVLAGTLTSTAQGCDRDPKRPVPTMWPACEDRQRRVKARLLRQSRAHCDAEGRERRAATQVRVASDRGHEDVGRGTWDGGRGTGLERLASASAMPRSLPECTLRGRRYMGCCRAQGMLGVSVACWMPFLASRPRSMSMEEGGAAFVYISGFELTSLPKSRTNNLMKKKKN